jgi:hypothetical protein
LATDPQRVNDGRWDEQEDKKITKMGGWEDNEDEKIRR